MEAVEELKRFVIFQDMPWSDFSLFGVMCPYCGKSDRIRKLESPDAVNEMLDPEDLSVYRNLWKEVNPSDTALGVCKFCQNVLQLDNGKAQTLTD